MTVNYPFNNTIVILEHLLQRATGYGTPKNEISLYQEWYQSNPLFPGQQELEDRAIKMNICITDKIKQWMRNNAEWFFVNERRVAAAAVANRLSSSVNKFMQPRFLTLLSHYDQAITDDARWMFIEPNIEGTSNGVKRLPFDMIIFLDIFKTSLSYERIFATVKHLLSRKHEEIEDNYSLQISCDGRFTLNYLSIYVVN